MKHVSTYSQTGAGATQSGNEVSVTGYPHRIPTRLAECERLDLSPWPEAKVLACVPGAREYPQVRRDHARVLAAPQYGIQGASP